MPLYDFYLSEHSVHGGDPVGFPLGWKGLVGISGLPARPYRRWYPWILDPANPDDPVLGHWGTLQWQVTVALVDGLVDPDGLPSDDGRTAADMRDDLLLFQAVDSLDLQDIDGVVYTVRMTLYSEEVVEPYDATHPNAGFVVQVGFAAVTA